MLTIDQLKNVGLHDVEQLYNNGRISYDTLCQYIREWNAGPHFTQAVFSDGRIHNFETKRQGVFYRHLFKEFGVRL